MIRVVVSGSGSMGHIVVAAVEAQPDMEVVGIIEPLVAGSDFRSTSGTVYGVHADPATLFASAHPDVVVDFTNAQYTSTLAQAAIEAGVRPVIGTSGISAETMALLRSGCAAKGMGGVVAANFALGAVVLMRLSEIAARFFDTADVIELHHAGKVDSPSGTALATARMMRAARDTDFQYRVSELEHLPHARGAVEGGVALHSVRSPGFVAAQEVILGGAGQTLTLRHDTIGRECYQPGIVLAVREVMQRTGLIEGLDTLIGLREPNA